MIWPADGCYCTDIDTSPAFPAAPQCRWHPACATCHRPSAQTALRPPSAGLPVEQGPLALFRMARRPTRCSSNLGSTGQCCTCATKYRECMQRGFCWDNAGWNSRLDLLIALCAVASPQRRVRRRQVQVDHHVRCWQAPVRRLHSHISNVTRAHTHMSMHAQLGPRFRVKTVAVMQWWMTFRAEALGLSGGTMFT